MEATAELIRVNVASEDDIVVRYFLYCDRLYDRPSFSIECRCGEDSTYLADVTSVRKRAEEIFELFVRSKVTPISAYDAIEEILS